MLVINDAILSVLAVLALKKICTVLVIHFGMHQCQLHILTFPGELFALVCIEVKSVFCMNFQITYR